jgi:spermidine synthase
MLLKKWLSHLTPIEIERASSVYNPFLQVRLHRGRFQLCTEKAIYSYADLYDNFTKTFDKIPLAALPIKKVLVLGVGLGSVMYILEKLHHRNYEYIGVEIDEKVIELAKKYGINTLKSDIQLICADAAEFVANCDEIFDLIVVDIFLDDVVPNDFEQGIFLQQIKKLRSPKGILLYNRLSFFEKDRNKSHAFFNYTFKKYFPEAACWDVDGNWMLVNTTHFLE